MCNMKNVFNTQTRKIILIVVRSKNYYQRQPSLIYRYNSFVFSLNTEQHFIRFYSILLSRHIKYAEFQLLYKVMFQQNKLAVYTARTICVHMVVCVIFLPFIYHSQVKVPYISHSSVYKGTCTQVYTPISILPPSSSSP